jgi:multidrug efflux pump
MRLSHLSIDRPVLTVVISLFITVLGIIAVPSLGVREFPAVDPPSITVNTSYAGASAEVIASQITEPLEQSVNGVDGIRSITSTSRQGSSAITVEFTLATDLDAAANDVRDRVSRVVRRLPADADPPTVAKADANSFPILLMTVQSDTRDILDVSYEGTILAERLQTIPGVAEIRIWGEKKYAMRLYLDPVKLAAHGLTLADVQSALDVENVELPSGLLDGAATEMTVTASGRLRSEKEFNDLVIRSEGDGVVRLRDVGTAHLGAENERTILKMNGKPMVGLGLITQPGANSIAIGNEFYRRYALIQKDLPADFKVGVGFDGTTFVRSSLKEVAITLIIAFVLVMLVLFFFLRDFRSALLPALAIPVSLVGSLFLIYSAGFTINVLTLLGLVLAIGLVVDDAIVVLENIYRKIEEGEEPRQAGYKGLEEIFVAVISTTAVLAVVFLPLFFVEGFMGRLFREFGLAVAGSVILSAIVSLTLTPMLSTRFLNRKHSRLYTRTEPAFQRFYNAYARTLSGFLHRRVLATGVVLASLVGCALLLGWGVPWDKPPLQDRGQFNIRVTAPEGTNYRVMDGVMDRIAALVQKEVPELDGALTVVGFGGNVNGGFSRVILKDPEERTRSQQDIVAELGGSLRKLPDGRIVVIQDETIQSGGSRNALPVQFVIETSDFDSLARALPRFLALAREDKAFAVVDEDLKFTRPELQVEVDRDRLRSLGISYFNVAQTLQLGLGETRLGYFLKDNRQFQIIGQVPDDRRESPTDLDALQARSDDGSIIPLGNLIKSREQAAPPALYHYNRLTSATVSAALAPGVSMGEGIAAMRRIAAQTLSDEFTTELAGPSRDFAESSSSTMFVFALAMILIYLVLAAQFESFKSPVIILITVPLSLLGALLALLAFGQTLNIFSQIGLIMLAGLVTKNGILILEFTRQKVEQGLRLEEAIVEASRARLRPILMTTLTAALGMLPIAMAHGTGAESRRPLGIAVVGGLLLGMALTLYVIPAMILLFSSKKERGETHA